MLFIENTIFTVGLLGIAFGALSCAKGQDAFPSRKEFNFKTECTPFAPEKEHAVFVAYDGTRLRAKPDRSAQIAATLGRGSALKVLEGPETKLPKDVIDGTSGHWWAVCTETLVGGYVFSGLLLPLPPSAYRTKETAFSPDRTYTARLLVPREMPCGAVGNNRGVSDHDTLTPIECVVRIEKNGKPYRQLNQARGFSAWFDRDSIYYEESYGDAGVSGGTGFTVNVETGTKESVYSEFFAYESEGREVGWVCSVGQSSRCLIVEVETGTSYKVHVFSSITSPKPSPEELGKAKGQKLGTVVLGKAPWFSPHYQQKRGLFIGQRGRPQPLYRVGAASIETL